MFRQSAKTIRQLAVVVACAVCFLCLHQRQVRPWNNISEIEQLDETPISWSKPNFTYLNFRDGSTFPEDQCSTCAIVFPSGVLVNQSLGKIIDAHKCVIRTNDAPVVSYERDVGRRTTYRISRYNALYKMIKAPIQHFTFDVPEAIFLLLDWRRNHSIYEDLNRYFEAVGKGGVAANTPLSDSIGRAARVADSDIELLKILPNSLAKALRHQLTVDTDFFLIRDFDEIRNLFSRVNNDPKVPLMTTGWYSFVFATQFCDAITVFGASEKGFCDNPKNAKFTNYYHRSFDKTICGNEGYGRVPSDRLPHRRRHDYLAEKDAMTVLASKVGIPVKIINHGVAASRNEPSR